jgi:serine/threonine protein kinase
MLPDDISINDKDYLTLRLMGRGKGGYSYLAKRISMQDDEFFSGCPDTHVDEKTDDRIMTHIITNDDFPDGYIFDDFGGVPKNYVLLKKIHHEPCDYYTFGDKIASEMRDYKTLWNIGIPMPKMYASDVDQEIIVKEFIDGPTILMMLMKNDYSLPEDALRQVREIAEKAKAAGLNIDYFPTNFIYSHGKLYYIDYECNAYMEEWSFDNWGIKYWTKTPELVDYIENHVKK